MAQKQTQDQKDLRKLLKRYGIAATRRQIAEADRTAEEGVNQIVARQHGK